MATRERRSPRKVLVALGAAAALLAACGMGDFAPSSSLQGVRILSAKVEPPYAAPGDKVRFEMLAHDARADRSRPMRLSWLPFLCVNPPQDLYYACFAGLAGADGGAGVDAGAAPGGGGAGEGLGAILRPGVDLTPFLPSGPTYEITLPEDIVRSHPPVEGVSAPYGLGIVFAIACAGHVEIVAPDRSSPTAFPIGCFDDGGNRLGPDDFVISFARVYAYENRKNANPEIEGVTFQGNPIDPARGIEVERCRARLRRDCPEIEIDVVVPPSSQEVHEGADDGAERKEQLWAAYFADIGRFDGDARLLYDATAGKVSGSENVYRAPNEPGQGTMFIVVHDNRGGANWVKLPIFVR